MNWVGWGVGAAAACLLSLAGCGRFSSIGGPSTPEQIASGHVDHIDPTLNLTREDYRHMAAPKSGEMPLKYSVEKAPPPIPKIADILAAPRPPKIGETQLVSIAVTDDVPLKDVLLELAKLADVDIELDAGITGGISFIARDKPFNEVIDRIATLADLRYTMHGGVLRVERDTPFIRSYSIDFLNLDRDSNASVNISTNVLSGSSGSSSGGGGGGSSGGSSGGGSSGGGGGLNTGSSSSVKSTTTGDFWKSLEAGVQQILAYQQAQRVSESTLLAETDANTIAAMTGAPPPAGGTPAAGSAAAAPAPKAAAPVAAPVAAANVSQNGFVSANAKAGYTINRQAGLLTVNGTSKQQDLIERFLAAVKANASAQVLIEGKIIEVDLNDQYKSGIDWQLIGHRAGIAAAATFNPVGNAIGQLGSVVTTPTQNVISFAADNDKDILSLVEIFGTTRTLSNPRLHAINNQQSTLTFATNQVYFQVTINTTTNLVSTTGTAPTQTTVNSQIQTVPIGIIMTMLPSIDRENNEVTLAVHPTLSSIAGQTPDPAVAIAAAQAGLSGVQSNIPIVQVRELDSTLKLKSGQTMVIGGLMQQTGADTDTGVPFASNLPIVGNLFKSVSKTSTNKELVLLIKATIVDTGGDLNNTDKTLFHKFSDDPRPVSF